MVNTNESSNYVNLLSKVTSKDFLHPCFGIKCYKNLILDPLTQGVAKYPLYIIESLSSEVTGMDLFFSIRNSDIPFVLLLKQKLCEIFSEAICLDNLDLVETQNIVYEVASKLIQSNNLPLQIIKNDSINLEKREIN